MPGINQGLQKTFNIEAGEGKRVSLLIFQSFFIGIFIGIFDVGAHGIFLKVYPETMIAKAYLISGIAGILITSLYTSLQGRMKFARLTTLNLVFIAIITIILRLGFNLTNEKLLAFTLIVFMGPLKINAIVGYNGTVVRMFSLRQGKRLFGLVDSGLILGLIISGYSVSLLMGYNFAVENLFIISAVSILCAMIIQFIITRSFNLEVATGEENKTEEKTGLLPLLKNRYIRLMAFFIILSMMVLFFLQYSFLGVLKSNYPDNRELTVFLGAFMSTLYVFTILVKTFVYSKFIKAYGLKSTLIISSIVLLLFTIIAAVIGSFFGFTSAAGSFTFFFLLISLSRLFVQAFKDGFEVPSFKLLYQSLHIKIRHIVQARIDGTINEFATVFSGIMLTVLISISFVKLIHFTYVLGIILLIWAFVASRLYRQYRNALEKSLAEARNFNKNDEYKDIHNILYNSLKLGSTSEIIKTLRFIKITEPQIYVNALLQTLGKKDKDINEFILKDLWENKQLIFPDILEETIDTIDEEDIKSTLKELTKGIGNQKGIKDQNRITELAKSRMPEERIQAIHLMVKSKDRAFISQFNILLRDLNDNVRKAAIMSAPQTGFIETIPLLIEYLSSTNYYPFAYEAIESFKDDAIEHLEHGFYKTGIEDKVVLRIVRLISKIGNERAISFLLSKIDHYNRDIVLECVNGLISNNFKTNDRTLIPVQQAISKSISIAAWNFSALCSIDTIEVDPYLTEAINEEIKTTNDLLFALLSLAYDPQSIMHVRENLESGTSEGIGFAIELMDTFIAEELKPTLFPLLEDAPSGDKIRKLQNEFPIEKMDTETLLLSIINRDYNYINNWTRLCAIENLANLDSYEVDDAIIAMLFHPEKILHDAAALLILNKNAELLKQVLERLPVTVTSEIKYSIENCQKNPFILQSNKVKYLKQFRLFNALNGKDLVSMSRIIEDSFLKQDDEIILNSEDDYAGLIMVPDGEIEIDINGHTNNIAEFQCFNAYSIKEIDKMILKAKKDCYIYFVKFKRMNELMFDNPSLTDLLLHTSIKESQEATVITM
ncbi:MAG: hypothetical protein JXB49_29170 [Bacteroidales bacterium]|nr:hypothetical protein [Bacteroidales bacterium]